MDRENITWPGNQLELIHQLSQQGKPLVVLQMGGGQIDSSSLKASKNVNSLIWGGYPGQAGGQALFDIITGKRAPAGRLVATQYPAEYALQFSAIDMNMRPSGNNPGQTYMWYTGKPVYEFGHGLFYTTFKASHADQKMQNGGASYKIADLANTQAPFLNFTTEITNAGETASDYTAMVFANTRAGPAPYPNKWLVGFDRLATLQPGASDTMTFPVTADNVARVDEQGNRVLYPGKYELALNNERSVVLSFTLTGEQTTISKWPAPN
jgi:beta-D-xylosidase 4